MDPYERKPSLFDAEDFDGLPKQSNTRDYYSILNVSQESTPQDIKNAYKKLAMLYHPDKHEAEQKILAQDKFHKIQKAYDVLIDQNKRYIYDLYGENGLDEAWDLAAPLEPEKFKQEYERREEFRREMEVQKSMKSKGEIKLSFDVSRMFHKKKRGRTGLASLFDKCEMQQAQVIHSWDARINDFQTITVQGNVVSKNGLGTGSASVGFKQIFSNSVWTSITTTIGDDSRVLWKLGRNFSNSSYGILSMTGSSWYSFPTTSVLFGRMISAHTTGYISYTPDIYDLFGIESGQSNCVLGMMRKEEDVQTDIELQATSVTSQVVVAQTRSFGNIKGRCQLTIARHDISIGVLGEQQVAKSTIIGLGVDCGVASGIMLKLKFSRLGQKLSIPIRISESSNYKLAFTTLLTPIIGYIVVDKLFLNTWRKKMKRLKLKQMRDARKEELEAQKNEAAEACSLLAELVSKRLESENAIDDLVIILAEYGKLPPSNLESVRVLSPQGLKELSKAIQSKLNFWKSEAQVKEYIDVTIPVQSLVSNNQLHIAATQSKSQLIGFYDPCFGEKKQLRITYQFQGKLHQITAGDGESVALPMRGNYCLKSSYRLGRPL